MKTRTVKILLGAVCVSSLMMASSVGADYSSTILADAPAGYWRLAEMPATLDDIPVAVTNAGSLGDSATGGFVGYVRRGQPGALAGSADTAYRFWAGDGRVSITNSAFNFTGTTSFSLEVWAKPTVTPTATQSQRLISNGSSGQGYGFTIYGTRALRMTAFGVADRTSDPYSADFVTNQWYHFALVRSNTVLFFYVNGALLGVPLTGTRALNNIVTTANPLALGATGVGGEKFTGYLDEPAVYDKVLTPEQITAHFNAGVNNGAGYSGVILADQPIGYWRLNEPPKPESSSVIANSSTLGTVADGQVFGSLNTVTGGVTGALVADANTAMGFAGSNGKIDVPFSPSLNTATFSVECWANLNSWSNVHQSPVTSRFSGNAAGARGYIFYAAPLAAAGNAPRWEFWTGLTAGNWDTLGAAGADVVMNQWAHLVGTYDSTTRTKLLYVNGQLVNGKLGINVFPNYLAPLRIGGGATEAANGSFLWNGAVDEVAVYPSVLSPQQVQAHYEVGSGSSPTAIAMPGVAVEPSGQTNWAPYPITLSGVITGSLPIQLQWFLVSPDGMSAAPVPQATNMSLRLDPTSPAQNGNYFLAATNALGSVVSTWAYVEITPLTPPTITSQPLPRTVYAGSSTRFSVQAVGTPPLSYQWKKAGADISGATNQVLVVTNISAADAGVYSVGITNLAGGIVSPGVQLTLRTPAAGTYEEAVLAAGPVAYWRLGEPVGSSTAFDWAGGYDGSVLGGVTAGTAGPSSPAYRGFEANNTAYTFNGLDAGLQSSSLGLPGPLSVAAWINPNVVSGNRAIVGENASWFFKLDGSELRVTTPGVLDHNSSGASLETNKWYHVAVTFQPGAANGAKFYVNGRFISSVTASALARGNSLVWIGTNQWANQVFDGAIDEVAVYNKILAPDTIATMYSLAAYSTTTPPLITEQPVSQSVVAGTPATLTVGAEGSLPLTYQWKKDGASIANATGSALNLASATFADAGGYSVTIANANGSTNSTVATVTVLPQPSFAFLTNDLVLHLKLDTDYNDSSGLAHDAFGVSTPALVPGKLGQAVRLVTQTATSVYQYLMLFDTPDLQFSAVDSFSVSFWLKYTNGFNDLPIIGNAHNSTYNPGWVLTENAGQFAWTAEEGAVTVAADPAGGPLINDGTWHHLAVVFDRTNGIANSFVDGLLTDTRSLGALGTLHTGVGLFIGQDDSGAYPTVFGNSMDASFDLDDLGIWRRVLSPYEVLSIHNAAQGASQSFDVYGPVSVTIATAGANLIVAWQAGTLESNTDLKNPNGWAPVQGASAPVYTVTPGPGSLFFRVRQ